MFPIPAVSGVKHQMSTPRQKAKQQSNMRQARSLLPIPGKIPQGPFFIPPQKTPPPSLPVVNSSPVCPLPIPTTISRIAPTIVQLNKSPQPQKQVIETKVVLNINQKPPGPLVCPMLAPPPPPVVDRGLLKKVFPRPVTPAREIDISIPELYNDENSNERYGIRCVCNEQVDRGVMIQCEKCMFWLHASCVNIARSMPNEKFLCPFCKNRPIRCSCGNKRKYDEPIIQCVKCKYWVHKSCANLGYGRNPPHFICSFCGGGSLSLPYYTLHRTLFNDFTVTLENSYADLIEKIPNGMFKNFVVADLNKKELHFNNTVARYFNAFAAPLFEEDIDFWSILTSTLCEVLQVDKKYLLSAIDNLATQLMYERITITKPQLFVALNKFSMSERAQIIAQTLSLPKYDKPLNPVKIAFKNGKIVVESSVYQGGFICAIPGFMCHFFEAPCENGIKLNYVSVPNSDFVIDTEGTSFALSRFIKRSFHYNCHPKLVRVKGEIMALLFAHHMKGPLSSSIKSRKGPAIAAGGELFLPFDSDLPWETPNDNWMDKTKQRPQERHYRRRKETKEKSDQTLLSVFYPEKDITLPFKVLSEKSVKEIEEDAIIKSTNKILTRRQVHIKEEQNGI